MRDMTADELAAWNGMIGGDLNALANVLDGESDELHPTLRRWLVKLIRGTPHDTDYRITLDKHPDLPRVSDGLGWKRLTSLASLQTAQIVAKNGGFERGQTAGAFRTAMDATGLSERQVKEHWSKHQKFLRAMRARGIGGKVKPR